jgi:hypothetical protein
MSPIVDIGEYQRLEFSYWMGELNVKHDTGTLKVRRTQGKHIVLASANGRCVFIAL